MSAERLVRLSTVDALTEALRRRILDDELRPGTPLREEQLSREYRVARHSLRSALRALQVEHLVQIEPNRGARVAILAADQVRALAELRTALEIEGARLALRRGDGRLPRRVHECADHLAGVCGRRRTSWAEVAEAHEALHHAIVRAAESPRLEVVHRQAGAELRLFVLQRAPAWTFERLASDHRELVRRLESDGAEVLRPHIEKSTEELLAPTSR